jgi:hypothetical protein
MSNAKLPRARYVRTQKQLQALVEDIRRDWSTQSPTVILVPDPGGPAGRLEFDFYPLPKRRVVSRHEQLDYSPLAALLSLPEQLHPYYRRSWGRCFMDFLAAADAGRGPTEEM